MYVSRYSNLHDVDPSEVLHRLFNFPDLSDQRNLRTMDAIDESAWSILPLLPAA